MARSEEELKMQIKRFEEDNKYLSDSLTKLKKTHAELKPEEQAGVNLDLAVANSEDMQEQNERKIKFLKEYLKLKKESEAKADNFLRSRESALKTELIFLEYIYARQ